jgi:uncharacterized protein YjbJ (UPF0337 family)
MENAMETNRLAGIGHQVKGGLKEGLGKVIGDAKLTADGAAERVAGEAQTAAAPEGENLTGIDSDRIAGVGHQIAGAVKENIGHIAGRPHLEAEGLAEREAGKLQNAAGSARDEVREAIKATEPAAPKH